MPSVDGETFRSRLEREQQLPVGDAIRIAREVAEKRPRFRAEMRRGTVVEIAAAHHYIHYSHPDEVERAMRRFLTRQR